MSQDNRLLKEWREDCFNRDDGKCQFLGCPADNPHHIIKRRFVKFRYDVDNGICLSNEVHDQVEADPKTWMVVIRDLIGEDRFSRLREKFIEEYGYDYFEKYC